MEKLIISVRSVVITSILAGIVFSVSIYLQFSNIKSVSEWWYQGVSGSSFRAIQLAEIERNLGYVGFIHSFKNYVIRGDEEYFRQALSDYAKTKEAIEEFRESGLDRIDLAAIDTIDATIDEYYAKLMLARDQQGSLSPRELDKLVRVSDAEARDSLVELRKRIVPRMIEQRDIAEREGRKLANLSSIVLFLIVPLFLLSVAISIRSLKELVGKSKELTTIFHTSPDAILYVDHDGKILRANRSSESIFGYSRLEFKDLYVEDLIDESVRKKHVSLREGFCQSEQSRMMADRGLSIRGRRKDGSFKEIEVNISSKIINGVMQSVCIIRDIDERNQLIEYSVRDHLTGLYNRRYFDEIADKELVRTVREDKPVSLFLIDLDNFKTLNDTLGHDQGDVALKLVAGFLSTCSRNYDCLARWGGDEFVLLCPALTRENSINHAKRILENFDSLELPWKIDLTLSIGIATTSNSIECSKMDLLKNADSALYAVKNHGRNGFRHFEDE